jgi:hypothetical protein
MPAATKAAQSETPAATPHLTSILLLVMKSKFPDADSELYRQIRERVLKGLREIENGEFSTYEGRAGLKQFQGQVKRRCREALKAERTRPR